LLKAVRWAENRYERESMNGALLLAVSCVLFYLAYHFYGRLVERVFGVDPVRQTPAHTLRDGVDYVPTQPAILFGHHFASIAGAGPIVGPVLAAQFGWVAVALWVVLGCILIGSCMNGAMFLSIVTRALDRHGDRIADGVLGRMLFLFFCWFTLVLVVAEFLRIVAETFVEIPAVATASLLFIGLASASDVWSIGRHERPDRIADLVPLAFACVYVAHSSRSILSSCWLRRGGRPQIWVVVLLAYCFAARAAGVAAAAAARLSELLPALA
jgi:carbon starvation protein